MTALYDLGKQPTTFDFAAFAVIAKTVGESHVRFVYEGKISAWKYPEYLAWRRFGNIVLPICRLAGLDFSVGERIEGQAYGYGYNQVKALYDRLGRIEKLKPTVARDRKAYTTITLRDSFRNKYRNSNLSAWNRFAEYLKKRGKEVMVLPECETAPLDVEYRMELYASADMNLGVSNGPMALCQFSEAPYITINMNPKSVDAQYDNDKVLAKHGLFPGSQLAWRNANQLLVWEPDTYENIVRAYESLMDERKMAA